MRKKEMHKPPYLNQRIKIRGSGGQKINVQESEDPIDCSVARIHTTRHVVFWETFNQYIDPDDDNDQNMRSQSKQSSETKDSPCDEDRILARDSGKSDTLPMSYVEYLKIIESVFVKEKCTPYGRIKKYYNRFGDLFYD